MDATFYLVSVKTKNIKTFAANPILPLVPSPGRT